MEKYLDKPEVDGLLFKYKHFYGGYNYVGNSYRWYSDEIRVIRNRQDIYSYRDAQGFRKSNNLKLNVKQIDAYIYHYGWVKDPITQQEKQKSFQELWHDENSIENHVNKTEAKFDYSEIDSLVEFKETHPNVMIPRVKNQNWKFNFDTGKIKMSFKNKLKRIVEKLTGHQLGEYKNYNIIK
jgi:outer membrane protein OmpA-like peptidoglycan-associated protein